MRRYNRIVIKVGTKVIASRNEGLDVKRVDELAFQIVSLVKQGHEVLVVTSGAIGAGMWLLNMKKRPADLATLQATAAVGQNHLMDIYSEYFKKYQYNVGQILLTQDDFNDRRRYLNIKHTINALLEHKAIPVINENDTVATEEIKCGDNDRLSSLVADLCEADLLILLTDVDGLLDADKKVIREVHAVDAQLMKLGGKSSCDLGTGGMATKLESARNAMEAGIDCVIANGKERNIIRKIAGGEAAGTLFMARGGKMIAKKRWIAFSAKTKGAIVVDEGAARALCEKNRSLLASGISRVEGAFRAGDVIAVHDAVGRVIAKGVSNYSSADVSKVKGLKTSDFKAVLGRSGADEVIHKDNLVIL